MSGFSCMECGYKFRTVKTAEKAAFGDNGCPKCGSSDIDLSPLPDNGAGINLGQGTVVSPRRCIHGKVPGSKDCPCGDN